MFIRFLLFFKLDVDNRLSTLEDDVIPDLTSRDETVSQIRDETSLLEKLSQKREDNMASTDNVLSDM